MQKNANAKKNEDAKGRIIQKPVDYKQLFYI